MIKIFNTLFLLLISNLLTLSNLKSQDNLESIIDQKKRIEFEIDFLNRNNYLSVSKNHIFLLRENESEKDLKWNIKLLDYNFQYINDTTISLDRSYFINKIDEYKGDFHLFFKRNYSNDKKYLIIKYSSQKGNIIYQEMNFPLSLEVKKVLYFKNYFVFLSKTNLKINKINSSSFGVIISENNSNGLKVISRSIYDLNGNTRDKIRIENKDFSVIETRFLENKYAISILSNKRSRESVGVQYNKLENNMAVSQKVHLFENLNSITTLTNYKKTKRSKFRIGELFYIDSLSIYNNKILLTIESLKSDDNNDSFSNYQYIPFYNTYSGTYDRKINPRFGGYLHNYFMILSFNYNGEIERSIAKKIDHLQTFDKKIYVKYIFGNDYHLSSYVNKGKIFISKHFNKIAAEDKEYTYDIETFDNETTIKTETNPEGTYHLGNKLFISYGIQNIKKINNDRKRVFFINKIEIID